MHTPFYRWCWGTLFTSSPHFPASTAHTAFAKWIFVNQVTFGAVNEPHLQTRPKGHFGVLEI